MKVKKIFLEKWIDPALITHHLTKKFGDKGLAWLDSDGKENGEWSIIGIKPKKIIQSRDINNLDKTWSCYSGMQNHAVSVIAAELEMPLIKNGLITIIKNEN